MPKVITIGSAVKDVFLVPENTKIVQHKKFSTGKGMCFEIGGKYEASDIYYDTGGGATNAAATLSSLGVSAKVFSYVGNDPTGEEIIRDLKKRKVQTKNIITLEKKKTGYSTIMLYPSGDRSIVVYRGASSHFDKKDIKEDLFKGSQWVYMTNVKGNMEFLKRVFSLTHKNDIKVFWNPGKAEIKKGITSLKSFLQKTEVLSVNREEAEILTGNKDIKKNAKKLQEFCKIVLITDGKKGLYIGAEDAVYFAPSTGSEPLNTTGAGDAFGSGFLAGYIKLKDWQEAVKVGVWNADGVVQEMGAKHGIISQFPSQKKMDQIRIIKK